MKSRGSIIPICFLINLRIVCLFLSATNINDAVLRAVTMLSEDREDRKLPERSLDMIILLTDGMPNSGEPT